MKIYFLGPHNSYSHIAAKNMYADQQLIACKTFGEIFEEILKDKNAVGVLPIENSITSDIHENIDTLFKNSNLHISAESFLNIRLHLIGLKQAELSNIKTVYSHPRALLQCTKFIKKHTLETCEVSSTAAGKEEIIKQNKNENAVIGSKDLVEEGKTKILKEDIGDNKINMTRFVAISQTENTEKEKDKLSVIFKVPHIPGSLAKILTALADIHLNLTKIESRPIPGTKWEYYFWVDVEKGHMDVKSIKQTLQSQTAEYRILGVYKKGEVIES